MPSGELVDHLERYAAASGAPARARPARCSRSSRAGAATGGRGLREPGWRATSSWPPARPDGRTCPAHRPRARPGHRPVPALRYRNPGQLQPGRRPRRRRLGVGRPDRRRAGPGRAVASCSPSGSHTRMPRHYRGMDLHWWLERTGGWPRTIDTVARDPARPGASRRSSWPAGRRTTRAATVVDLATLQALGRRARRTAGARSPAAWPRSPATSRPRP